jgi:Taurine catabolism dioxygenase TauD, TfdA family
MDGSVTTIRDKSAWTADEHRGNTDWLYELTNSDLAEIDNAVRAVTAAGLVPPNFGPKDFVVPEFGRRLASLANDLENGRGFFLLRGLPVDKYSLDTIKAIYWGIGVHLGKPVYQNTRGDLMTHVADRGDDYGDVNTRLYTTAAAANPHNDPSDCVGLLCVRHATQGGTSMIASAMSIYNRVVAEHPEYLPALHKGFPHDLRGEGVTASLHETTPDIPVFSTFEGKVSCCLNSKSSRTARDKQGRPLTALESQAIDYIERLAESRELCLTMDFRPGDIQFLNNYAIIHTRTAFRDDPDPDKRRLLLRLWLNLYDGRALAPGFGDRFNNGSRGGVPAGKQ